MEYSLANYLLVDRDGSRSAELIHYRLRWQSMGAAKTDSSIVSGISLREVSLRINETAASRRSKGYRSRVRFLSLVT